jgi:hypothetical protein
MPEPDRRHGVWQEVKFRITPVHKDRTVRSAVNQFASSTILKSL